MLKKIAIFSLSLVIAIAAYTAKCEAAPPLLGDVTGDGNVSAYDASLAAQYAIGLIMLEEESIQRADATGNGDVSAYDASLIAQYAIGLIDGF